MERHGIRNRMREQRQQTGRERMARSRRDGDGKWQRGRGSRRHLSGSRHSANRCRDRQHSVAAPAQSNASGGARPKASRRRAASAGAGSQIQYRPQLSLSSAQSNHGSEPGQRSMTREEFDKLVHSVETGVAQNPAALRWRVAWWAMVGYSLLLMGFFLVLLLAGAFFAVMFWADLGGKILCGLLGSLILFGGGWAVLKALLIRIPAPKGAPVTRAEAPALFALLDDLRAQLRSVPFHHVLVVPEHNAAVVQVPRLGVLGWSRNYLLLGMPLLEAHSPEEVRAVLAHEFAHLSRAHGRFSHWIYRLRRSWENVFRQFRSEEHTSELQSRLHLVCP